MSPAGDTINKYYNMIKVIVDCENNDPVDIRCGGSPILGYDFYVESSEGIEDFIREELKQNNQPCMNVKFEEIQYSTRVWTKEMISKCIKEGYD